MKKKPDAAARLLRKHLKITDADAMTEDEVALLSRIRRLIAREVKARDHAWSLLLLDMLDLTSKQRDFINAQTKGPK